MEQTRNTQNPLGVAPVSKLMVKFAVPSIIAMLVGALYNIVDQFFIGQKVGTLGNAATNIAFPLSTSCIALALLFGIGGASCFNLSMGRGEKDKAPYFVGNAFLMLILSGSLLCLVTQLFLTPMLVAFGAPDDVLPFAQSYVRITAFGFPFLLLTSGGGHLIRADGSPRMSMICNISGAIINTALDAIFVLGFEWGMEGAALATVIGQVFSGALVIRYMCHYKTVTLKKEHLRVRRQYIGPIMSIGMASFFNQLAIMLVQIVLNNSLKYYGALSVYGESIPLACAGIVMKVSQLSFSVVIGIAQGTQPIESFNYGAKNYKRVREAYKLACMAGGTISVLTFAAFQLFPRQILSLFGDGTEEYFSFGEKYFRIFLFFTILNFLQPITSTFFTSIGKAVKGVFLSLTRQVLFLIPLVLILPRFFGIDGIVYAGPISDAVAVLTAAGMVMYEFRSMRKLEKEEKECETVYRQKVMKYKKKFEWIEGNKYSKTYQVEEPYDVLSVLDAIRKSKFSIVSIDIREDADIGLKSFEGSYSLEEFYKCYDIINKDDIESISIDLHPGCRLYLREKIYISLFSDTDIELRDIIEGFIPNDADVDDIK